MQTYTVYESPDPPADRIERAERLVFIKDGFSWFAALLAPLWLLVHRLWWPLLGYVLIAGAFELLKQGTPLNQRWIGLAILALNVLVGFEADSLRRWAIERRGWRALGTVTGRTALESERRFFEAWLPSQPIIAPATGNSRASRSGNPVRRAWGALLGARA
jgi:hypothetical protein